jgi:hypothetical protein
MSALLGSVAAYTVLLTLLVACAEHLWMPAALPRALAAHRVLPAAPVVAVAVTATEGLFAAAGIVAVVRDGGWLLTAALAGSAGLLALYGTYGLYVMSARRGGACGCSRVEVPMTGLVVTRAYVLAGMALVGLALAGSVVTVGSVVTAGSEFTVGRGGVELAVVLLAAVTFATLLWHLPAALYDPADGRRALLTTDGGVPR